MTDKHLDIAIRRAKHETFRTEAIKKLHLIWETDFKKLHDVHELIYCAIISIHYRFIVQSENLTESKVQLSLTVMSFIKGVHLTTSAISTGLYPQAYNLLKQEMETLCACIEIRTNTRTDKKTPNVKNLPYNLKSIYGSLNNVAHISHLKSLMFVNMSKLGGVSSTPQYNDEIAKWLYGLHVVIMHEVALEVIQSYAPKVKDKEVKEELEILRKAFKIIQNLEIPPQP